MKFCSLVKPSFVYVPLLLKPQDLPSNSIRDPPLIFNDKPSDLIPSTQEPGITSVTEPSTEEQNRKERVKRNRNTSKLKIDDLKQLEDDSENNNETTANDLEITTESSSTVESSSPSTTTISNYFPPQLEEYGYPPPQLPPLMEAVEPSNYYQVYHDIPQTITISPGQYGISHNKDINSISLTTTYPVKISNDHYNIRNFKPSPQDGGSYFKPLYLQSPPAHLFGNYLKK